MRKRDRARKAMRFPSKGMGFTAARNGGSYQLNLRLKAECSLGPGAEETADSSQCRA
jgi:hypothetical protein